MSEPFGMAFSKQTTTKLNTESGTYEYTLICGLVEGSQSAVSLLGFVIEQPRGSFWGAHVQEVSGQPRRVEVSLPRKLTDRVTVSCHGLLPMRCSHGHNVSYD